MQEFSALISREFHLYGRDVKLPQARRTLAKNYPLAIYLLSLDSQSQDLLNCAAISAHISAHISDHIPA